MKRAPVQEFRRLEGEARSQCGALCWRQGKDGIEVLLVTSRETGRWVIPKGWPMEGLDCAATAAREAWEEAGVRGEVAPRPVGWYAYDKVLRRDAPCPELQPCVVAVHPLRVATVKRDFPESRVRRARWFAPARAARKVEEPGLAALLAGFAPEPGAQPAGG